MIIPTCLAISSTVLPRDNIPSACTSTLSLWRSRTFYKKKMTSLDYKGTWNMSSSSNHHHLYLCFTWQWSHNWIPSLSSFHSWCVPAASSPLCVFSWELSWQTCVIYLCWVQPNTFSSKMVNSFKNFGLTEQWPMIGDWCQILEIQHWLGSLSTRKFIWHRVPRKLT